MKGYFGAVTSLFLYSAARLLKRKEFAEVALKLDAYNLRPLNLLNLPQEQKHVVHALRQATLLAAQIGPSDGKVLTRLISQSRSQLQQDVIGLLVSKEKKCGYFVEVGVGDGEHLSNTFLMEKEFGWDGLLCEPNKIFHEPILRCRTAKLDRRAVYRYSGKNLEFLADVVTPELSQIAQVDGVDSHQRFGETYSVPTVTLNDALEEAGAPTLIDFMSIDTEGSETAVIDGLDLTRRQIGMIAIEHNYDATRRRQYARFFKPHGYELVLTGVSAFDDWYVHRDYAPEFLANLR
jgi:FkbM family methyltransferase